MAVSGSETTALQSFGVPGMPRSFLAKTAVAVFEIIRIRAGSESMKTPALGTESMKAPVLSTEAMKLPQLGDETLDD